MYRGSAYSIDENDKQPVDSIERSFQVALIGDTQVGKTSILNQFIDRTFNDHVESTRGIDMRFRKLNIGSYLIKLRVWDSFGEDIHRSIREDRLKNINAIMLIFDLTDEVTLENLIVWNDQIDQHMNRQKLSKILVGNKNDLPFSRKVSEDAKIFANKHNMMYFETSAKNNHLILDSFIYLIKDLLNQKQIVRTERTVLSAEEPTCSCKCFN